jgi:tripartite-type tricarboxylate transporter receptor subunit TctC
MTTSSPFRRRQVVQALAAGLLPAPFLASAQTGYPSRPLRIVVPLPAGGAADVSVRILAETMQGPFGQPITVDNRPGGAYAIGVQQLTSAPPDGTTLLHVNTTMCAIQAAYKRYDMAKQMVPVAFMGSTDGVLVAAPNAPFKTIQEMVAWARANPGKLTSGTIGLGSLEHLMMLNLGNKAGFTTNQIPFKGGPDGALAVAQGEVMVMPVAAPLLVPFKEKVRPLASLVEKRNPLAPDAPTLQEAGFDIPPLSYWGGLMAPAGTPKAIIDVLQKHVATAIESPALRSRYTPLGITPRFLSGEELGRAIDNDLKWLGDVIKAANINFN